MIPRSLGDKIMSLSRFYDTGLLCALLELQSADQLNAHYLRGNIFESFVVSEYMKMRHHAGLRPNAFFWRDHTGHEIDLLLEEGPHLKAVEIKSGETLNDAFLNGLRYFKNISALPSNCFFLIYGGSKNLSRKHGEVLGWRSIEALLHPIR